MMTAQTTYSNTGGHIEGDRDEDCCATNPLPKHQARGDSYGLMNSTVRMVIPSIPPRGGMKLDTSAITNFNIIRNVLKIHVLTMVMR